MDKPIRSLPRVWLMLGMGKAVAAAIRLLMGRSRSAATSEESFTAGFPKGGGAVSAVTGGPPEDMNGMPATLGPPVEELMYGGSNLATSKETALRQEIESSGGATGCP